MTSWTHADNQYYHYYTVFCSVVNNIVFTANHWEYKQQILQTSAIVAILRCYHSSKSANILWLMLISVYSDDKCPIWNCKLEINVISNTTKILIKTCGGVEWRAGTRNWMEALHPQERISAFLFSFLGVDASISCVLWFTTVVIISYKVWNQINSRQALGQLEQWVNQLACQQHQRDKD